MSASFVRRGLELFDDDFDVQSGEHALRIRSDQAATKRSQQPPGLTGG